MEGKLITRFDNRGKFEELLRGDHPGVFVQFTASWCGPCKRISPLVTSFFQENSGKILCCRLDVDENADLYAYLKRKRLINGIPCLYFYDKSNHGLPPTGTVAGGNESRVASFLRSLPLQN